MGGRGAGSGGNTGGSGSGGVNPNDIVKTESLLSYAGKTQEINEVMEAVKNVYEDYGLNGALTDIQVATLKGSGMLTMAYYDNEGNLAVNKAYFDAKAMNQAWDASVEKKFHPPRGNKSGLEATASHELGHRLTEEVGRKMGLGDWQLDQASNTIMKNARKNGKFKNVESMKKAISGYAEKNNAEAVAEAFADVYCNGNKASKASKAVVKELNSYFNK